MKNKIKNMLKTNKVLYKIYSSTFNVILKILKVFIKVDDKIILFNSFGGKKYDDSPRVIYEYMKHKKKYNEYKMYWVLDNPEKIEIPGAQKLKNNSIKFFIIALRAKYWITNSGIERGLKFKQKNTIYINTWHGTAIKHIGKDENSLAVKFETSKIDIMFAQSEYDRKIFSHVFDINKEQIVITGLPRNDELATVSSKQINYIKKKLNLPLNKKIILYAPTFREYNRDSNGCILAPPINLKLWEEKLSDEYILLFRAHYEVNKVLGIKENEFIKNYSDYQNLNELLKISDILISDYSSIMIDFSILERPIFNYIYDFDEYKEKRGMYFDLRKKMPRNCIENEAKLLEKILNINFNNERKKTIEFKNEFVQEFGNARKYIDNIITIER